MKIKVLKAFAGFIYDSKGFKGGMVKLKVLKVLKARWEACDQLTECYIFVKGHGPSTVVHCII